MLTRPFPRLLDDRTHPGFREVYGTLLAPATDLDVALTHLRLSTLDLTVAETARLRRVRLLLAQVSGAALDAEARGLAHRPDRAANVRRLAALLEAGAVEVRSAPLGGWSPDFSVFGVGDAPVALLVGAHRFDRADFGGPVFGSLHGPEEAARARVRFEEAWARAHDIAPALGAILSR